MDALKKEERELQRVLAALGVELDQDTITEEVRSQALQDKQIEASREAEAVLLYTSRPKTFQQKECGNCGGVFAVDRASVGYCSDSCRSHYLARLGIVWDWKKPQEYRWQFQEPLVIRPQVLAPLIEHLEKYQEQIQVLTEEELVEQAVEQVVEELPGVDSLLSELGLS